MHSPSRSTCPSTESRGIWQHDTLSWSMRKIMCALSLTWTYTESCGDHCQIRTGPSSMTGMQNESAHKAATHRRFLTSLATFCVTLEAGPSATEQIRVSTPEVSGAPDPSTACPGQSHCNTRARLASLALRPFEFASGSPFPDL